jgi:hypothetical protein
VSVGELTSPDAVRSAVEEFDRLGRDAFLERYGFGRSWRYLLRVDGNLYDSKAIVGAAFGYQYPDRGPLPNTAFSGGDVSVKRRLEQLGFEVVVVGLDRGEEGEALQLPQDEVDAFALTLTTPQYASTERDYKVAVHEVVSRLLANDTLAEDVRIVVELRRRSSGLTDVLYNHDQAGRLILRKWSEHGLGHLLNPIDRDADDRDFARQVWQEILDDVHGLGSARP